MLKNINFFSSYIRSRTFGLINNNNKLYKYSSKRKSLQQNIKQKQQRSLKNQNKYESSQSQPQNNLKNNHNISQLTDMKILTSQFFPISLLLTPTFYYFGQFESIYYLLGITMAQKYATGALFMNLNFKRQIKGSNKQKLDKLQLSLMLISTGLLHCLPGYYSILTSLGMSLLTIMAPFKFVQKQKQQYSQLQIRRQKNISHIKMIYFFIFIFLGLLKGLHYQQTYKMERKLSIFDQENKQNTNIQIV